MPVDRPVTDRTYVNNAIMGINPSQLSQYKGRVNGES
jgi:hypothetical protein